MTKRYSGKEGKCSSRREEVGLVGSKEESRGRLRGRMGGGPSS